MGDSTAPLQDETAGNHDITLVGSPTLNVTGPLVSGDEGAVQFNGTRQAGSVALNLSDTNVLTIEFWLWWDSYGAADDLALEFTPNVNGSNGGFIIDPDAAANFDITSLGDIGYNTSRISRPSAAAWHHYAIVFDRSQTGAFEIVPYVDGVAVSYSKPNVSNNAGNFANSTLFLMSRNATALFGDGRMAWLAVYKHTLSPTRIAAHHTAGV
jgi:hypothetical protein